MLNPMKSELLSKFLGPKPIIHYSHRGALKVFETLGFKFEVRRFGEGRLGLLRWPLRKTNPGVAPRRIVFTPGFGDTPLSWWTVLVALKPVLKRKYDEVILMDFPGFSGFLHNEAAFDSMDELLRCYHETMRTLAPKAIMGHSLGAWLATDYAIATEVDELVLIDPGGLVGSEGEKQTYRDLFVKAAEGGTKDLLPHVFKKAPIWVSFFEEEFLQFLKTPEIRSFISSFEERHLLNERLSKMHSKTTILWGEHDTMTPVKWIEKWMNELPSAEKRMGVIINGSGHSPQIEKPGVTIAVLTQVLLGMRPLDSKVIPFWKRITA